MHSLRNGIKEENDQECVACDSSPVWPHEDTLGIREVSQEEGVRCWGQRCGPWLFTKEAKLCVRERETWLVAANAEEAPARKT